MSLFLLLFVLVFMTMTEPQKPTITTRRQLRAASSVSVADYARWTGLSRFAVRKAVHEGRIPVVEPSAYRIRIPASHLRRVLGMPRPEDAAPVSGVSS